MENYFFSNKKHFEDKESSVEIAEFFPIIGLSATSGIFFQKQDCAVGCILSIAQCRPEQLSKIGKTLSRWLRTSSLVSEQTAFTISIHKKLSITNESEVEISLKPDAIICISVAHLTKFLSSKNPNDKIKIPEKKTELTLLNCEALTSAVNEITSILRKEKIIARLIDSKEKAMATSRFFWTDSKPKKDDEQSDSPAKYFASGLSIHPSRTFWKDGEDFKMMFNMKVPSLAVTSLSGKIDKDDFIAQVLGMDDVLHSGTMIFILSAGGPDSKYEASSIAGILDKPKSEDDDEEDEDEEVLSEDEEADAEDVQIRLAVNYISQMPWKETVGHFMGKLIEAKELLELENFILGEISTASNGGDWSLVDTAWLDILYSIVPGALRMDKNSTQKNFEIIHII